jgi:CRP-like cAMP-binding protein
MLASGLLVVAGLLLFARTSFQALEPAEKILLALGIAAVAGLTAWLAVGGGQLGPAPGEVHVAASQSVLPLLALILLVPTLFSFWRTPFGPAWAMLALSLAVMVISGLTGLIPLWAYLLLAGGLLLHDVAYRSLALPTDQPQPELDLSDARRLQRALGWTASALLAQFRQIAGDRAGSTLVKRFNAYAQAADWQVSIAGGKISDALPAEPSMSERGERSAAALSLLLELVAGEVGKELTVQSLQRAYDGLPWEEREIGGQYLFRDVRWAAALSAEFQTLQQEYRRLLQRMPLFATMDSTEIDLVCSRLRMERRGPGRTIIRQGEPGDRFYIVRRGHVEVTQRDERGVTEVVNQLDRGDYFGELALLHSAPRNATCQATVPTELLSLSRHDFDQLVKARFGLRAKIDRSLARTEMLRRVPLFAEMDAQQLRRIAAQMEAQYFEPGAALMRQGELGETFYVIESGQVQVLVRQNGQERIAAQRGSGEYVGEIALLLQVPRTATVKALTPARVLALHKNDFDCLARNHLYVSRQLERDTSRRMLDLQRAT